MVILAELSSLICVTAFAASCLDTRPQTFTFQSALFRRKSWPGSAAIFRRLSDAIYDFLQPGKGVAAVHLLGAVLLGFQYQYARLGDAAVVQRQEPLF